jgi:hypothetical protein
MAGAPPLPKPAWLGRAEHERRLLLEQAYAAACAFIDAHVGDPDMTQKMRDTHAEFVRLRKELESR